MKKFITLAALAAALLVAVPAFAKVTLTEEDITNIIFNTTHLVQGVTDGDDDAVLEVIAPEETALRAEIREVVDGKPRPYALDCIPREDYIVGETATRASLTCGWVVGRTYTKQVAHFVFEKYEEDGDMEWLITSTDFHEELETNRDIENFIRKMMLMGGVITIPMFLIFAGFWLWMLVDCLRRNFSDKTLWVLLMIFLGPLGALLYLFMVKLKKPAAPAPRSTMKMKK